MSAEPVGDVGGATAGMSAVELARATIGGMATAGNAAGSTVMAGFAGASAGSGGTPLTGLTSPVGASGGAAGAAVSVPMEFRRVHLASKLALGLGCS